MSDQKNHNRRQFMKLSLLGLGALPFVTTVDVWAKACGKPTGKALKKPIDDATAKRLQYVVDASVAKAKKSATDSCANCAFYQVKRAEGDHAPCTMAGLKYVASCGWCKSFKAAPTAKKS